MYEIKIVEDGRNMKIQVAHSGIITTAPPAYWVGVRVCIQMEESRA